MKSLRPLLLSRAMGSLAACCATACSPAPECDPLVAPCDTTQTIMGSSGASNAGASGASMSGAGAAMTSAAGSTATGTALPAQAGAGAGGMSGTVTGVIGNMSGAPSSAGATMAGSSGMGASGSGASGMGASGMSAGGMTNLGGMGGSSAGASLGGASVGGSGPLNPSGFAPCPATGPCKILPLGDSITDGFGVPGGYRIELFRIALGASKDITFVGDETNGPSMVDGQPFPQQHQGHSGWTISQVDGLIPDPALEEDPNIILLHIGTNDMYQTPDGAPDRLGDLIDHIIEGAPDALLVVSTIIPFPGSSSQVATYNDAVPGVVQERADQGAHILLVDQFAGFPTDELDDNVHPNEAGYARMAGVWWDAIVEYLP